MNLYFLVSIDTDNVVKLEETVIPFSNTVSTAPQLLPTNFLNVSNFNNLETSDPSLLLNLSWLGRPDLGFWLAVFDVKPSVNYYKKIITTNTINQIEKTVTVSYTELDLTPEELDAKRTKIKSMNVPIRDSYLKLTDFTQLADAPISDQAKTDFLTFRQQLRSMFDIEDYSQLTWPTIPSSAPNITIPPFPPIDLG
jgi:hypothetical protein